ncbi:glycosyltransferase family 1 protein [Candidatus Regiella endosymbiont of Tuberolachnus salignus]|uniref:glycosyltransferase family 4 protein n=1 Tax=Candidatus Regiella endosymbiont of Tuberolachnus salignus TaxID=3077956 RepID=UPI0030CEE14B
MDVSFPVAVKILFGTDAIRYPLTGIGRYAYELARRLSTASDVESLFYFSVTGGVNSALPSRPKTGQRERTAVGLRRLASNIRLLTKSYHHVTTILQARSLRRFNDYLFHGPNYYLPVHRGPCVTTFHDLSVFSWPQCHPAARVRHMQKEIQVALKRAQLILTDSEFTRREIAAYFSWPLDRILVTPLAVSADYYPRPVTTIAPVLLRFGLNFASYSLFVGTLDPRKNIDLLLDVYEKIPNALRQRIPLIVVGFEGWNSEKTRARLSAGERAGWARYLNFVDEALLPSLYAGARVFLYPSRYEGFGLPVLEAMASGIPVICSNAASLPEVAGSAGALVPPDDVDTLYNVLIQALEDDSWCAKAKTRGLEQASHFSWDKTAAATLNAYKLAYSIIL